MSALPFSDGLLILPRLRVQNANAISSPLTHGFPSMTAFLGLMWALARKLEAHDLPLAFASVGVICRDFAEQVTEGGSLKAFRLSRKPLDKDGASAAIVEEGCMQMENRLIFGVSGGSHRQPHLPALHLDLEARARAHVRRHRLTILQVEVPAVQRAGDLAPVDDALRQRPALVCAFVMEREDLVVGVAEDGDVAAGGALHDARAQAGDVVERADAFPVGHDGFLYWKRIVFV